MCNCSKRLKKERTTYSSKQLFHLEEMFKVDPKLSTADKRKLSTELKLTEKKIMTWFSNRRAKEKRLKMSSSEQILYN
jgi:hypothetical protein